MSSISSRFSKSKAKNGWKVQKHKPSTTSVKKLVQKELAKNEESKFIDTELQDFSEGGNTGISADLSNNNSAFLLNSVIPGDGNFGRDGNKIILKSLRLRITFTHNFNIPITNVRYQQGQMVRYVVIYDNAPGGALPTWNSVFGGIDTNGTGFTGLGIGMQVPFNKRMRILLDKTVTARPMLGRTPKSLTTALVAGGDATYNYDQSAGDYTQEEIMEHYDHYIDLSKKRMDTFFKGTDGSTASIATGALYLLVKAAAMSSSYALTKINANMAQGGSFVRLRYTDN